MSTLCPGACGTIVEHRLDEKPSYCRSCEDDIGRRQARMEASRDDLLSRARDECIAPGREKSRLAMPEGLERERSRAAKRQRDSGSADTGSHYRHAYRARITDEDIARGFVEIKLDPYRIAAIYRLGGGPREHIVKKGLRGTAKGDSERALVKQLRDALDRWEEMLDEDQGVTATGCSHRRTQAILEEVNGIRYTLRCDLCGAMMRSSAGTGERYWEHLTCK